MHGAPRALSLVSRTQLIQLYNDIQQATANLKWTVYLFQPLSIIHINLSYQTCTSCNFHTVSEHFQLYRRIECARDLAEKLITAKIHLDFVC